MANLSNLNKLPYTRVFVAAENGAVELLELVALFPLKTRTFSAKNWQEISVDFILCFVEIFLRKEKGKYTVTLINRSYLILPILPRIQHKVVILVLRTVLIRCRVLITQFLSTEALGKNTLAEIGSFPLFVCQLSQLLC